jgi:hypothetical protein
MAVPILIPWDLYHGKVVVWCEAVEAGARRAVLLPRLDTIFAPQQEDPSREREYGDLDWRLISPRESDWLKYEALVAKQAQRSNVPYRMQRVESLAQWVGNRNVVVPQYHIWLYDSPATGQAIDELYAEPDAARRARLWRELLAWQTPANLKVEED